ncbi:xanthine dehydrogenase family protein molybdopterin-binding subunit [Defluviitalea phaphyphila]|uniref:xanthine dehydrogenase family protein molybdopterin-binding subunit n=1 Tax=Defluviitalea phaphyphila TaxID=1473580 RepID=UPI0007311EFA|nr:xanthine dehydrogenase family protein molybdopterin-binding subunit [Defluviitalea phaphyphila]
MKDISISVKKKDHEIKTSGRAIYVADMKFEGMFYAKVIRSTIAKGKIKEISLPNIPDNYYIIDAKDIPGKNALKIVESEQPIFSEGNIEYMGEAIMMIVGPDKRKIEELSEKIKITYEEEEPVFTIEEAYEKLVSYHYEKGDYKKAFQNADEILEETFITGYQEQAYIEPQGVIGIYENNKITIYGSMQCPYYVKEAVMLTMGMDDKHVQVIQNVTGGGFGGKEDYPSMIGCQVAVAAKKVKRPVALILDRKEDMLVTPKRHPARLKYRVALNNKKEITAIEADIRTNAGAYLGLSGVVLQRALIAAIGVYKIENLYVSGAAMKTNTVPNGAYRGFGAPQTFFAIEMLMNHIGEKLGLNPLEFKKKYIAKKGDTTATNGKYHYHVPLDEMIDKAEKISGYSKKYKKYSKPQTGRYRRGIGMSLFLHGCGFTGSAERDYIKSIAKLVKNEDDTVEIFVSNTDMGQGLHTTFSKIVANTLGIPLEKVYINNPDTDKVPNSGPTVASRSIMIVGKLLERAAKKMKEQWKPHEPLTIIEHYKHIDLIPWDIEKFQGDAYPAYSYGLNVVEVEVDMLLATTKLLGVWGIFDVGKAIDKNIIMGQLQGGMLQGIGYASMEKMENKNGQIYQANMTDYMIPTAKDTIPFNIELIDNPYEGGPFGAKGAGELPLVGVAPAYVAAVENAINKNITEIPLTPEKLMEKL